MNYIIVLSIVILFLMELRTIRFKIKIRGSLKKVKNTYKILLSKTGIIFKLLVVFFVSSHLKKTITEILTGQDSLFEVVLKISIVIFLGALIVYVLGLILYMLNQINGVIVSIPNNILSKKYLVSFAMLILLLVYIIIVPQIIIDLKILVLLSLMVSYIINMQLLFTIMFKPSMFKNNSEKNNNQKMVIGCSLILVCMIILNIYLGTVVVNMSYVDAYLNTNSSVITNLDLFYYTMISFTTIGYGDIVPILSISKMLAVTIAFTSVICLVIFISFLMKNIEDK